MGLINENAWKVVIRLEFPALGPQNSVHVNVICLLVKSCIICCMSVGYILVCLPFFISGSIQIFAYVVGDFASFLLAKSIFLPGQSLCLLMTSAFFLRKWSFFLENYHFGRKLSVLLENYIFFRKWQFFLENDHFCWLTNFRWSNPYMSWPKSPVGIRAPARQRRRHRSRGPTRRLRPLALRVSIAIGDTPIAGWWFSFLNIWKSKIPENWG